MREETKAVNRLETWARRLLRRIGATQAIKRAFYGRRYEAALEKAMQAVVRPGDVIWDVGANVGFFSTRFAQWTGPQGSVYAFEPAPDIAARLRVATAPFGNVVIVEQGLSDTDGTAGFLRDRKDDGATSRIAVPGDRKARETIRITTGDLLIANGTVAAPDVIKMDIEGHEFEALMGVAGLLSTRPPRHLFIEMHRFLFVQQGRDDVPWQIEKFLHENEYDVAWVDESHLHALLRSQQAENSVMV
jgi:FkbM family methyltransferase